MIRFRRLSDIARVDNVREIRGKAKIDGESEDARLVLQCLDLSARTVLRYEEMVLVMTGVRAGKKLKFQTRVYTSFYGDDESHLVSSSGSAIKGFNTDAGITSL